MVMILSLMNHCLLQVLTLLAGVLLEKQVVVVCSNLVGIFVVRSLISDIFPYLICSLIICTLMIVGCAISHGVVPYSHDSSISMAEFDASSKLI